MPILPFLLYVFVMTFTPGPNNIMSMSNANRYGFKKTLRFIFGVSFGFLVILLLSSYFNLLLYSIIPKVKLVMGILGSLYMVWLAYRIMMSSSGKKGADNERLNSFLSGFGLQFINFKGILYAITAFSSFVIPYYRSNGILILISAFMAIVFFSASLCWAGFGSLFQRFLSKYEKPFHIIMGLSLLFSAVSIYTEI
ncbi:LysE family transporter [Gorillibacterium massiliense]|uniref:LysE family transporter n=1 Tax=Gorillibacterium massiliense TaxID=1280390 RepID=UPI0004BC15F9|nr:LysE family transporter [Gorillibacterium massiliense]